MKKLLMLAAIVTLFLAGLHSCKKDKKGEAPVLPSYESMIIDFSNFTTAKHSGASISGKGTETSTWEFAAEVAGVWNSLITTNILVPIAAYENASGNSATYVSENVWQWAYDFTFDGSSYSARLKAQTTTSTVTWKLYITKEGSGGYTDFLWVEGTSKTDATGGQWKFNQSPQSQTTLFITDWTQSGDQITSVKYTYAKSDTYKDSYITYTIGTGELDASYYIHFSNSLYSDAEIEWNTTTNNGRVNCLDYLNDENWYCWDSNKVNIVCN